MPTLDLPAKPEPLAVDPARTALVVNDMQNAFYSPGGYLDRIGFDLSGAPAVVDRVTELAALLATGDRVQHLDLLRLGGDGRGRSRHARHSALIV